MLLDQKSEAEVLWKHTESKERDSTVGFKKAMPRCSEMFVLKFKLIEKSVISLFLFLTQFGLISPNLPLTVEVSTQKRGWAGSSCEWICKHNIRGSKQYPEGGRWRREEIIY